MDLSLYPKAASSIYIANWNVLVVQCDKPNNKKRTGLVAYLLIFAMIIATVGILAYSTYPNRLFGAAEDKALVVGYTTAMVFAISVTGSKLFSTNVTWLFSTSFIRSHVWLGHVIRYVMIGTSSVMIGILTYNVYYYTPINVEYSESAMNSMIMTIIMAPVTAVAASLGSSKL